MKVIIKLIVSELVFIIGYVLSILILILGIFFHHLVIIFIGAYLFLGVSKNVYKSFLIYKKNNEQI